MDCENCKEEINRGIAGSEHMVKPSFKCCNCQRTFNSFEEVNEHMKPTKENNYEVHAVVQIEKCLQCKGCS